MMGKLEDSVKIVGYVSFLSLRVLLGFLFSLGIDSLSTLVPDEDFFSYLKKTKLM